MSTVTNTQVAVKYRRNVSSLSIDMSTDNRTTTLGRHIDRCLTDMSADISSDISVDISIDTRPICRPTLGRYVDRYVGRLSTDMSFGGCTKYTWSKIFMVKTIPRGAPIQPQSHSFYLQALGFHGNDCFWYHVITAIQKLNGTEKPFAMDIFSVADQNSFDKRFSEFFFSRSWVIHLISTQIIYETPYLLKHCFMSPLLHVVLITKCIAWYVQCSLGWI